MEKQNEFNVIVSEEAAQMLISHAAFLGMVSESAAERLISSFEKIVSSLDTMPQRCPWLNAEGVPKYTYRYILFEKRYMAIFKVFDNVVLIGYVVDCRQDYSWLFQ